MPRRIGKPDPLVAVWRTSARVTAFLVENLPPALLSRQVPGAPRRTVGMIAGHIHNARCMWIKVLGAKHGVAVPRPVDRREVGRDELLRALPRSSAAMVRLLELSQARGGQVPRVAWLNFPADVSHFLAYFVAHEGHHRGQIVMLARALGHRLPAEVTHGLWSWTKRRRESR